MVELGLGSHVGTRDNLNYFLVFGVPDVEDANFIFVVREGQLVRFR